MKCKMTGFILNYICLVCFCFSHRVTGRVKTYSGNVTWMKANKNCILNGGKLVNPKSLNCSELSTQSNYWFGVYQSYIWLKPIGCYHLSRNISTINGNITDCIQHCKTGYIGYHNPRCYCLKQKDVPNVSESYSACKDGQWNGYAKVYTFLDLKNTGVNTSCVYLECEKPNGNSTLHTASCHVTYNASCVNQGELIYGNHTDIHQKCFNMSSFVRSEKLCSLASKRYDAFWTDIKRFRKKQYTDGLVMIKSANLLSCTYGICTDGKLKTNDTKCENKIENYACLLNDSTTYSSATKQKSTGSTFKQTPGIQKYVTTMKHSEIAEIPWLSTTIILLTNGATISNKKISIPQITKDIGSSKMMTSIFSSKSNLITLPTTTAEELDKNQWTEKTNYTTGFIAGVSAAVLILCLTVCMIIFFVRRKMITKAADHRRACSNIMHKVDDSGQEPNQLRSQKRCIYKLDHSDVPKSSNTPEPEHKEISGEQYAFVNKINKQNKASMEFKLEQDDEYNTLNQVMKNTTEAPNTGIYDTMLCMREVDDPTYNATMHGRETNDCQYDSLN